MTDGERLVWAASFTQSLARDGDTITAVYAAARTIEQLREIANRRAPSGDFTIAQSQTDRVRDFLDEIVNVP